jgi:tetratricopeptide (TPR) repeat protein
MGITIMLLFLSIAWASDPPAETTIESDETRAKELYDNGVILYQEGRYEDAIVAWEEAYRLSQKPLLLYNIANAEERLGRYQEALDHLNRYRAYAPAEEREILDRRIVNLERRIQEQVPTTPVRPEPEIRLLPIVLFGVGGGSLVVGGVFGGLAGAARGNAAELCMETASGTWCQQEAAQALQADKTDSLIADIGFAVAAAGIAGGVITLVLPQDTRLSLGAAPGMLTLKGSF